MCVMRVRLTIVIREFEPINQLETAVLSIAIAPKLIIKSKMTTELNEANGLPTILSDMSLVDNNSNFFTLTVNDGTCNHEVYLAPISSITVDSVDNTLDVVEVILPYNSA